MRNLRRHKFDIQTCLIRLLFAITCLCAQQSSPAHAKVIEAGVKYDFDASGKPSFNEINDKSEPISWAAWHQAIDQAIASRQYDLLVGHWKTRGPAFAVIDYTVTAEGKIEAHALPPDDPEFKKKFRDAQEEYHLNERTSLPFLTPNGQFEQLTLKAYRAMDHSPLLKFPEGSKRKIVRDVRWHIDASHIKRSVRSRDDDVETHE